MGYRASKTPLARNQEYGSCTRNAEGTVRLSSGNSPAMILQTLLKQLQYARMGWRMATAKSTNASISDGSLSQLFGADKNSRRTAEELMNAYGELPWLRAITSRIAGDVSSSLNWQLFVKRGKESGVPEQDHLLRSGTFEQRAIRMKQLQDTSELEEVVAHPLLDLLNKFNDIIGSHASLQASQLFMDLNGNAFIVKSREKTVVGDLVTELYPIPPHWVEETPSHFGGSFKVNMFGSKKAVAHEDMIWIKDINPADPYGRGVGFAQSMADELATDEYASKHTASWFKNGARPEHIMVAKGVGDKELRRFQEQFEDMHGGVWKAFRTFWWNKELEIKELSQKFSDMELIRLREFDRDLIIQVFGVPPGILGINEDENRATLTQAQRLYAQHVVIPRTERIRNRLQNDLVTEFDENLVLSYPSPIPDDQDYITETAAKAPHTRSRDEWRKLQGLPPDENSPDVYYVPAALIPTPVEGGPEEEDEIRPLPAAPSASQGPHVETMVTLSNQPPSVFTSYTGVSRQLPDRATVRSLREQDIDPVLNELIPETLASELDPEYEALVRDWGDEVLKDLGIDSSFNMLDPAVVNWLEERSTTNIRGLVHATTRKNLRDALVAGVREGESSAQIARRVRSVFRAARGKRAIVIARTEVLGASNYATWQAQVQSGVVEQREWIATPDEKTRDEHNELDGQVVNLHEVFTVQTGEHAGSSTMYPGGFGLGALDISCRCTTAAVISKPKTRELREAHWKAFDRRLIPWERQFKRSTNRGFDRQQSEILTALDRLVVPD